MIGVDTVYLDYQKAFDWVPHKRLLQKLKAYGIEGQVLAWISSFLTGRHMTVSIRGQMSEDSTVHSGVPQGSVIGPILFLAYVNDIVHKSSFLPMIKVWSQIQNAEDRQRLRNDLLNVCAWSSK